MIEAEPTEPQEAPQLPIGALLAALGRGSVQLVTAAMRPTGIKPRHIPALTALRHGPMTQQALGEAVHTDPTQLVVLLNELETAGLVSRRRCLENRRRHIVELSADGDARLADAEKCIAQTEERLLAGLNTAERVQLRHFLTAIMTNTGSGSVCDQAAENAEHCDTA
jgi:DNA-binding MarR family transcriptional regulator